MLYKYIRTFGNLLHCIWPYSLSQRFSRYYAWFYTAWIAHNVRKIGLHTVVEPGLYLVNGKNTLRLGTIVLSAAIPTSRLMKCRNTILRWKYRLVTAACSVRICISPQSILSGSVKTSARGKACSFRTIRTEIPKIWRSGTSHRMPGLFIPKVRSSSETMCGSGRKPRFWPESRSARGPSSVQMRWLQKIFPRIRSRQGFRPES